MLESGPKGPQSRPTELLRGRKTPHRLFRSSGFKVIQAKAKNASRLTIYIYIYIYIYVTRQPANHCRRSWPPSFYRYRAVVKEMVVLGERVWGGSFRFRNLFYWYREVCVFGWQHKGNLNSPALGYYTNVVGTLPSHGLIKHFSMPKICTRQRRRA